MWQKLTVRPTRVVSRCLEENPINQALKTRGKNGNFSFLCFFVRMRRRDATVVLRCLLQSDAARRL